MRRMTTLTDLSQLTKSMVKKPVVEPKPAPTPKAQDLPVDREAAGVLAGVLAYPPSANSNAAGRS